MEKIPSHDESSSNKIAGEILKLKNLIKEKQLLKQQDRELDPDTFRDPSRYIIGEDELKDLELYTEDNKEILNQSDTREMLKDLALDALDAGEIQLVNKLEGLFNIDITKD